MERKITCRQAVDYISKREERQLTAAQRFHLWRHLAGCSLCRIFSMQNKFITNFVQFQESEQRKLSAGEKQAIVDAVLKEG